MHNSLLLPRYNISMLVFLGLVVAKGLERPVIPLWPAYCCWTPTFLIAAGSLQAPCNCWPHRYGVNLQSSCGQGRGCWVRACSRCVPQQGETEGWLEDSIPWPWEHCKFLYLSLDIISRDLHSLSSTQVHPHAQEFFVGSVTTGILAHSKVPVVVVPQPQ